MNRRFEYELVNLNDYSEEDIMSFGDALSFVLLVDKVRDSEGKSALTCLPSEYEEKLRLHIPENLSKLLADVVLCLLGKKGFNGLEARQMAAIADKADRKEYGGMFEAVIESYWENWEKGILKGREEGLQLGLEKGVKEGKIETARNALAEGLSIESIQRITGLDAETIRGLKIK